MGENQMYDSISKQRHYQRKRQTRSVKRLVAGLSVGCALLFFLTLFLGIQLGIAARETNYLTVIERKQARELEAMRPELDQLKAEVAELVKSRIPNLNPLKFDEVITVEEGYVRNIVFTLAKKNDVKQYEYKMVMDNRGLTAVHPDIKLLFFNHIGIQVGGSEIGVDKDGEPTLEVLERGEIRTRSSVVELSEEADPSYFLIRIVKPKFD